ncbi:MAG: glycosyltransferase [Alphaproteobacteria bacterium]|nr:glycosyltransferase [Alphaproteobacteria bacterium]
MKPKISVIIPMYNVEKYLKRCLDSVQNQTFQDWQAICVDDGSPDKSGEIAEEYASRDKRFVVLHKKNGGLSDARNAGMKKVKSEYVMFLDSDDFIHPQTMEFAYALAQKNNTDIVSWYKDKMYRPWLLIRHKLGLDTERVLPRGIKKHFDLDKVKYFVAENIFDHSTELSRAKTKWAIKHCYVWRHLIKTDFIRDIEFIKGILFEDFPWWSTVMLRHPSVTITNLPFYYYYPNLNSIDMGSKKAKKIISWLTGLKASFVLYKDTATDIDMQKWQENYMWPVIVRHIAQKLKNIDNESDKKQIQKMLQDLDNLGVFAKPIGKNISKYVNLIYNFIGK